MKNKLVRYLIYSIIHIIVWKILGFELAVILSLGFIMADLDMQEKQ